MDPVTLPDDKDVQDVVAGLLGQQKIPQEKYDAPQTSAQALGLGFGCRARVRVRAGLLGAYAYPPARDS